MQKPDQKINYLVVPIVWVVAGVTALILGLCKLDWIYYLIGVFTGLLNYGLMLKTNRRIVRLAELYPEEAAIHAKKQAVVGWIIRLVVFLAIFLAIFFKDVFGNPDNIWLLVIAFSGYATIKIVLIAVYIIFRKKVSS